MIDFIFSADFLSTFLRVMTPLLFAALGVMISDRAGVLNIGMEGMMLSGAFTGVVVSAATNNAWLGFVASVLTGAAIGILMAFAVNVLRAHLIIVGIAVNVAASSATVLGLQILTGARGMSGSLKSGVLPDIPLPGLLGGHNVLTWVAVLAAIIIHIILTKTRFGLHLRAVGTDPAAAAIAGITVARVQSFALMLSGALGGMGGAYLSMGYVSWFAEGMTSGRGFIAIAIAIMGFGSAVGVLLATFVVAFAETLSFALQRVGLPSELIQMLPYVVPIVVLAYWSSRERRRKLTTKS